MEKLSMNYHLKLQEMCDCYLETDFKNQLKALAGSKSADLDEEAIKYLALAIMYGVTEQADKLSIKKEGDETQVTLKAEEKISLASPAAPLADRMIAIMRAITHIEGDKGEIPLSLGLRNDRLELQVKIKREGARESVKIAFPGKEA